MDNVSLIQLRRQPGLPIGGGERLQCGMSMSTQILFRHHPRYIILIPLKS